MVVRQRFVGPPSLGLVLFAAGMGLMLVAMFLDWNAVLASLGFPAHELSNPWVRADIGVVRSVTLLLGALLVLSRILLWRSPTLIDTIVARGGEIAASAERQPLLIPMVLIALILGKTVLQLVLYMTGYTAFSADDFGRPLSAAFWLRYQKFDLGMDGWLGLAGSGWLPFSDYLFGGALLIHPDLFVAPRILNLVLSSLAVVSVYLLGRELFDRTVGLITAALFAFQPWIVWLGMSGMSSDLPSAVLVPLFGMFLVRWLRTDRPSALIAAAACLGIANGFRYENWLFAAVFSVLVLAVAVSQWKRRVLSQQGGAAAAVALILVNALPVGWMAASYVVLGDWLPAMHGINAFMVAFMTSQTARTETQMNMALMAAGSFPFEIVLSCAGIVLLPASYRSRSLRLYLYLLAVTALLFFVVFRGQLAAWLHIARYFLGFVALVLPFGGLLVTRLVAARPPWRNEGVVAACLILLTILAFDLRRSLNYPAAFPRDAISTGWAIRHLQETGTVSPVGKVLIERGRDFGDLSIVALANKPERFVVLNELAFRKMALSGLLANRPALVPTVAEEGVRGTVCEDDFRKPGCLHSVLSEGFELVILSSPQRAESFARTFGRRPWTLGRYNVFDMRRLPPGQPSMLSVAEDPGSSREQD
jgi:hypothetical protein